MRMRIKGHRVRDAHKAFALLSSYAFKWRVISPRLGSFLSPMAISSLIRRQLLLIRDTEETGIRRLLLHPQITFSVWFKWFTNSQPGADVLVLTRN